MKTSTSTTTSALTIATIITTLAPTTTSASTIATTTSALISATGTSVSAPINSTSSNTSVPTNTSAPSRAATSNTSFPTNTSAPQQHFRLSTTLMPLPPPRPLPILLPAARQFPQMPPPLKHRTTPNLPLPPHRPTLVQPPLPRQTPIPPRPAHWPLPTLPPPKHRPPSNLPPPSHRPTPTLPQPYRPIPNLPSIPHRPTPNLPPPPHRLTSMQPPPTLRPPPMLLPATRLPSPTPVPPSQPLASQPPLPPPTLLPSTLYLPPPTLLYSTPHLPPPTLLRLKPVKRLASPHGRVRKEPCRMNVVKALQHFVTASVWCFFEDLRNKACRMNTVKALQLFVTSSVRCFFKDQLNKACGSWEHVCRYKLNLEPTPSGAVPRPIVLDGANIAFSEKADIFDSRLPVDVATGFLERGHSVWLVLQESRRTPILNRLTDKRHVHTDVLYKWISDHPNNVYWSSSGDRDILELAATIGGAVVSRDRFFDSMSLIRLGTGDFKNPSKVVEVITKYLLDFEVVGTTVLFKKVPGSLRQMLYV